MALMAGAGYLVAALVVFPTPLLPDERPVPRVLHRPYSEARAALEAEGLGAEVVGREGHHSDPAGAVVWQDPPPGVAVRRGHVVELTVSEGPPRTAVPDVRGLGPDLARRLLWAAGLQAGALDSVPSRQPPGVADGTTPAAGDSVPAGTAVVLHVSRGVS